MNERVKIIFPTDFSDESMKAFGMAKLFAHVYKAELFLLHVIEPPTRALKIVSNFDETELRKKAVALLQEIVDKNPDDQIEYIKMIKVGKVHKAIMEAAKEVNSNAIIMGTHGDSGLHEILVGSNAGRVIRQAPCHVISLREKPDPLQMKRILLPLDLTKETGEKVNLGVEFAQNFGAEIVVVSVLKDNDPETRARLEKRLTMALDFIKNHGITNVTGEMMVASGEVADAVIDYGKQVKADMILIMTQTETNFKESMIGSSAERVVNHSPIPVMACKPKRVYRETKYSSAVFN
jgi:nucleotide-binding universal stress UspA family protein